MQRISTPTFAAAFSRTISLGDGVYGFLPADAGETKARYSHRVNVCECHSRNDTLHVMVLFLARPTRHTTNRPSIRRIGSPAEICKTSSSVPHTNRLRELSAV
jgi:hypothetical protein